MEDEIKINEKTINIYEAYIKVNRLCDIVEKEYCMSNETCPAINGIRIWMNDILAFFEAKPKETEEMNWKER